MQTNLNLSPENRTKAVSIGAVFFRVWVPEDFAGKGM